MMTMVHMLCQRVMDERRRKRIEEENIIFSVVQQLCAAAAAAPRLIAELCSGDCWLCASAAAKVP
jgi:hypothetical protein